MEGINKKARLINQETVKTKENCPVRSLLVSFEAFRVMAYLVVVRRWYSAIIENSCSSLR